MKKEKVEILEIPFLNINFDEMVNETVKRITESRKTFIVTANPEIVMYAKRNDLYKNSLLIADYIVPDGFGILLGSRILGSSLEERVTGFDLTMKLLELSVENSWRIFLLGGTEDTNEKAATNMLRRYPGIKLAGRHHGFFQNNEEKIIEAVQASKPDIILVAMGFPKQEQWIASHLRLFEKGVFIGVGGTIDVLAGTVKRAPLFWRKSNLEWLYRLIKQPSRWKRMLFLPLFVLDVLKSRFKK
ncbi:MULTISPECIES: WecB/TagA/CpsF family glycosyltransferase [unclassified Mesobacillus]|uniref:WecB/TagA/CpsF family glycosyltransferase n=1 Tax=unclassified Mesobacillus TaxID=2675270 RepID=UPI00203E2C2E|nr:MULTISPECIES: WecB/TagA/CpsF family glycosyltransferase [unclassified Mesobacillus]MCM3124145.1 WecB/TagA/CpsF family glycosyltransferase [Mesobacillus sp. MER 33]MCM3233994.1 WecB/TagA/CpsF family glycosyltransferase [Mesobacillus sp. MER 48]